MDMATYHVHFHIEIKITKNSFQGDSQTGNN